MGALRIDGRAIARVLEENLARYALELGANEIGRILDLGDGIAHVDGLPGVMSEEMILFSNGIFGMAMNLEQSRVGAIVFGDCSRLRQGDIVKRTGKVLQVPVGPELLGRVVNALGQPIDGRGPLACSRYRLVETEAPGVIDRQPVARSLLTGIRSIDAMTAIGRGQRELIIGDRQTGKTSVALSAILSQAAGDVPCIYVAIGQKMASVAALVDQLEARRALERCIVVVASASDSAPLQYVAPFTGCAMGEYFRDEGQDALIVYDDLSKHAVAYRQISLILGRPPGREAFPGDIFYLHSRLLERSAQLSPERGGGSLTALPIVETQQGDYSGYIPTNLISITDGQIYLDGDLFHQGFRPAVDVGLSVSRVGSRAQMPAMKKVAGRLRLSVAQYRELASFARLAADLDASSAAQLGRGERVVESLKQEADERSAAWETVVMLWATLGGHVDHVAVPEVRRFLTAWVAFVRDGCPQVVEAMDRRGELTPDGERVLGEAMARFGGIYAVAASAAVPAGGGSA